MLALGLPYCKRSWQEEELELNITLPNWLKVHASRSHILGLPCSSSITTLSTAIVIVTSSTIMGTDSIQKHSREVPIITAAPAR
jgi:hypothetical protein